MKPKQERQVLREVFYTAWSKQKKNEALTALEQQIANIIAQHPEYHHILEDPDAFKDKDYTPQENSTNPFFHMALHASLMDQVTTDRPAGILAIYTALASKTGDAHSAEHEMMRVLGKLLWEAQRAQKAPQEAEYLKQLKLLLA
jgi:hypothetical protein